MTSEQKVKQVYPDAVSKWVNGTSNPVFYRILSGTKGVVLADCSGDSRRAWAAAWRKIQADQKGVKL